MLFSQISTALPPIIPRQPLPAIEAPPTSYFPALDLPLSSTSHQQSLTSGSESGESSESTGIFITQVAAVGTGTEWMDGIQCSMGSKQYLLMVLVYPSCNI